MKALIFLIILLFSFSCNPIDSKDNTHIPVQVDVEKQAAPTAEAEESEEAEAEEEPEPEEHAIIVIEWKKYNYSCWIYDGKLSANEEDISFWYEDGKYEIYISNVNVRYINFTGNDFDRAGRYLKINSQDCTREIKDGSVAQTSGRASD